MIDTDDTAQLIAKRLHSGKYWTIIEADDIRFAADIKRKFYSGERSSGFESVASPSGNFTAHFARKDWLSGKQLSSAMDERLLGVVESRESNVIFPCIPGYESRVWEVANAFVDFIAPHYREAASSVSRFARFDIWTTVMVTPVSNRIATNKTT